MTPNRVLIALCVAFCLSAAPAFGQMSRIIMEITDTPNPVTSTQVDEWIKKAESGDWQLMTEFAAAYLYKDGCKKLKFGHRCRAMQARPDAGRKFLFQIIDTPVDPKDIPPVPEVGSYSRPLKIVDIGGFQKNFAEYRLKEAPTKPQKLPASEYPECKDYIKYMSKAAENRQLCAARRVSDAYFDGFCTKKDKAKSMYFEKLDFGCPIQ